MKFSAIALLAFASVGEKALARELDCTDCFEDLDEVRDCLRVCNNDYVIEGDETSGSLLDACIAEATDDSYSNDLIDKVNDLGDFSDCCRFDGQCERHMEDSEECFNECLPACIRETPIAFLDCITDEMDKEKNKDPEKRKCGRSACLNGFLSEDGLQDELGLSGDVLELENLEKRLQKIEAEDLEECGLLEDFVEEVCEIGDNCCEKCNAELGAVIDCVINDVVIPYVALDLNTSIAECPIDEGKCAMGRRRELTEEQVNKFNGFLQQQKTKRDPARDARLAQRKLQNEADVEGCGEQMVQGILIQNVTEGGNNLINCVVESANAQFAQEVTDDSGESASAAVFSSAALVAVIAGSMIAAL